MPRLKPVRDTAKDVDDDIDLPPDRAPTLPPDHPVSTVTKPVLIDGQTVTRRNITRDPLNLKIRLYIQISEMLTQLEVDTEVNIRERIAALSAVGRLQGLLIDKSKDEDENVGSSVRKYESAFKNGSANKRKKNPRSNPEPDSDNQWLERELGIPGESDDPDAD